MTSRDQSPDDGRGADEDGMRAEYDFTHGRRNIYSARYRAKRGVVLPHPIVEDETDSANIEGPPRPEHDA